MKDLWSRNVRDLRTKNQKNKEKKYDRKNVYFVQGHSKLFSKLPKPLHRTIEKTFKANHIPWIRTRMAFPRGENSFCVSCVRICVREQPYDLGPGFRALSRNNKSKILQKTMFLLLLRIIFVIPLLYQLLETHRFVFLKKQICLEKSKIHTDQEQNSIG